ncbi:hypothetical protein D9M68_668300 [compost metagenome]
MTCTLLCTNLQKQQIKHNDGKILSIHIQIFQIMFVRFKKSLARSTEWRAHLSAMPFWSKP